MKSPLQAQRAAASIKNIDFVKNYLATCTNPMSYDDVSSAPFTAAQWEELALHIVAHSLPMLYDEDDHVKAASNERHAVCLHPVYEGAKRVRGSDASSAATVYLVNKVIRDCISGLIKYDERYADGITIMVNFRGHPTPYSSYSTASHPYEEVKRNHQQQLGLYIYNVPRALSLNPQTKEFLSTLRNRVAKFVTPFVASSRMSVDQGRGMSSYGFVDAPSLLATIASSPSRSNNTSNLDRESGALRDLSQKLPSDANDSFVKHARLSDNADVSVKAQLRQMHDNMLLLEEKYRKLLETHKRLVEKYNILRKERENIQEKCSEWYKDLLEAVFTVDDSSDEEWDEEYISGLYEEPS